MQLKTNDYVFFTNRIGQVKRATIMKILQDGKLLIVPEDDENTTYVTSEKHCEKICEGCDGIGKTIQSAHQQAGEIVEEEEILCTMCNGTRVNN